jgi:flagellar hook-basal body complex protein FliE
MDIKINPANLSPMPGADSLLDRAGKLAGSAPGAAASTASGSTGPSFLDTFQDAMHAVEGLQADASGKVQQVLSGTDGSELHTTMIAVEKADLAFQMMMQVRNKIVQAYQEVARMPF